MNLWASSHISFSSVSSSVTSSTVSLCGKEFNLWLWIVGLPVLSSSSVQSSNKTLRSSSVLCSSSKKREKVNENLLDHMEYFTYTILLILPFKSLGSFKCFCLLYSPSLHLQYLIKHTVKTVTLWNSIAITFLFILHVMYSCDAKAEFSAAITPVFSVTWSRNNSNLLNWWSRNKILIIINVSNNCAA